MTGSRLGMQVPYFDLKLQYASLQAEIQAALDRVCRDSAFIMGEEVVRFEREFADYCGARHCIALNTGTSALHLALLAAGVGEGDEVITTALTFVATAEAISYVRARPVFVDVDPTTANIDPAAVEAAITARTKAIIPVHLYGRPADLESILRIAAPRNIPVIEDACQAHGARHRGKRAGSFGFAAAFSFYPGKNLGAYGEGGALTTSDDAVAARVRTLRDHGQRARYYHDSVGFNYRMDGFQGAVLRIKLRHLDAWNRRRKEISGIYRAILRGARVQIPSDDARDECAYHLFAVCVEHRDAVRAELENRKVGTAIHYPVPIHLQKAYSEWGPAAGKLPHAESIANRVLSMPIFPEMTDEQAAYAATMLSEIAAAS